MSDPFWVPIFLVGLSCATFIALVLIVMGFILLLTRRGRKSQVSADEAETLQRLWQGLCKMETRINNLESILLEKR